MTWEKIKKFFKDSETIAFGWLNMVVGGIATAFTFLDPDLVSQVLQGLLVDYPWVVPLYLALNGWAIKWLRERRDEDMQ